MKKRTLLSMLLMLAMTLSLVGCGSDDKKPTSTDTAVNGTEATTDVAEKPTEVETPTPEPEKNVITLMSADGKEVVHEFNIPNGYTVVSDKKGNKIELTQDTNAFVKVEIFSGVNNRCEPYDFYSEYPPQYDSETMTVDMTNHTNDEKYITSRELYINSDNSDYKNTKKSKPLPDNKTYTIKVTTEFNETEFDIRYASVMESFSDLQEKIETYINNVESDSNDIILDFMLANITVYPQYENYKR